MSNPPQELLRALVSLPLSLPGALHEKITSHSRHLDQKLKPQAMEMQSTCAQTVFIDELRRLVAVGMATRNIFMFR